MCLAHHHLLVAGTAARVLVLAMMAMHLFGICLQQHVLPSHQVNGLGLLGSKLAPLIAGNWRVGCPASQGVQAHSPEGLGTTKLSCSAACIGTFVCSKAPHHMCARFSQLAGKAEQLTIRSRCTSACWWWCRWAAGVSPTTRCDRQKRCRSDTGRWREPRRKPVAGCNSTGNERCCFLGMLSSWRRQYRKGSRRISSSSSSNQIMHITPTFVGLVKARTSACCC